MPKKPLISKRFLSTLLIAIFGFFVLLAVFAASYKSWLSSANINLGELDVQYPEVSYSSINDIPEWYIREVQGYQFLEIYDYQTVMGAFRDENGNLIPSDPPAYKLSFNYQTLDGTPAEGLMGVVPLTNYDYATSSQASDFTAAYKLLTYGQGLIDQTNQAEAKTLIDNAVAAYEVAIDRSQASYQILSDWLYSRDNAFYEIYQNGAEKNDPDVVPAGFFPPFDSGWSLSVSVAENYPYKSPTEDSLALKILYSAQTESGSIGDTASKAIVDKAIANYRSQIRTTEEDSGLKLTSVDQIKFGGEEKVTFSVDFSKLIPSGQTLTLLQLKISGNPVCTINFSAGNPDIGVLSGTNCNWDNLSRSGSFIWNANTGTPEQKISTKDTGVKNLLFAGTGTGDKVLGKISKAVTILRDTSDGTQTGNYGIKIITPHSTNKDTDVPIKISASALNQPGDEPIEQLSWYICNKPRADIIGTDSSGCAEKGTIQIASGQTALSETTVPWDAHRSSLGTKCAMVKAFGPANAAGRRPYVSQAKPSKTVSDDILVTNVSDGGGGGGGGGGNVTNPFGSANFQEFTGTIKQLIDNLGGLTLFILGFLAVLAIIIAGMKYITSGGEPKAAETGKKGVLFAVFGIAAATMCVMLAKTTIAEVKKIIGPGISEPEATGKIIQPTMFTGPNATVSQIFDQNGLIWHIIKLAVYYAEVVAVFFIMYASFLYLTSYGDESKAESAKKTLIWAIIGLAIVIAANYLLAVFAKVII